MLVICALGAKINLSAGRMEITQLEFADLMGFDGGEDGFVEVTVIRNKNENTEDDNGEEQSGGVISARAKTVNSAVREINNSIENHIPVGHISHFLLGENLTERPLLKYADYIIRNPEIRLSSNLFFIKGGSAKDLLNAAAKEDYRLNDKLLTFKKSPALNSATFSLPLTEFLKQFSADNADFVIPAIDAENFTLPGYAVVTGGKVTGFLEGDAAAGYNLVKGFTAAGIIDVEYPAGNIISLELADFSSRFKFEFDGEKLTKIIIKCSASANIKEAQMFGDIDNPNMLKALENLLSGQIRRKILSAVTASKQQKSDFLNLGGEIKFWHPYKWRGISEDWLDIFENVPVEVEINSKIARAFYITKY